MTYHDALMTQLVGLNKHVEQLRSRLKFVDHSVYKVIQQHLLFDVVLLLIAQKLLRCRTRWRYADWSGVGETPGF